MTYADNPLNGSPAWISTEHESSTRIPPRTDRRRVGTIGNVAIATSQAMKAARRRPAGGYRRTIVPPTAPPMSPRRHHRDKSHRCRLRQVQGRRDGVEVGRGDAAWAIAAATSGVDTTLSTRALTMGPTRDWSIRSNMCRQPARMTPAAGRIQSRMRSRWFNVGRLLAICLPTHWERLKTGRVRSTGYSELNGPITVTPPK
jgi:hypothetical protein